ncbi:GTP-binding protein 10 isoform X3 [Planococcus citri]|uniref:GTP-binding protein 10 isoform X3 n=1 Tax=Planococcus citri TaxID=170843 RepID=UPI0031F7FBD8
MVFLNKCVYFRATPTLRFQKKYRGFVDSLVIHVRGGAGGMGYPKFGGVGGKGGDVILAAKEGSTLKNVLTKYPDRKIRASKGIDSNSRFILGKPGKSHIIDVPVGVDVMDNQRRIIVTTIKPNVGIMKYPDLRSISVADLPGLIEDAHKNVGMGHRFLRHCERTKFLVLVVDINGFRLNLKHIHRTCLETVVLLNKEIELFRDCLLDKPALLVVNKMDSNGATDEFDKIKDKLYDLKNAVLECPSEMRPSKIITFDEVLPISAKTSISDVENLKLKLREYLDMYAAEDNEYELLCQLQHDQEKNAVKYV